MLTITDPRSTRRDFLRVGSLGLGGLALASRGAAAPSDRPLTDRTVVLVFMHGGSRRQMLLG